MARPLRLEYDNAVYHVTSRGNAGTKIFRDDTDRIRFLEVFGGVVERFGWLCYAYCLMTNHYHLLIETPQPNLSRGMQHLNGVYTQWFNHRHSRAGHLVQGRFKSIVVEKESHLLELARYIVLNPVRAKLARSARDWRWSSYRATAGQVKPPAFLTVDWLLSQFHRVAADTDSPRVADIDLNSQGTQATAVFPAYRQFVQQGKGVDVWEDVTAGVLMGSDAFVQSLKPLLRDVEGNREIRREERLAVRPTLEELFAGVQDKPTRNERIHAAVRKHQYRLKEVGDHLGLCYSTISVIAKRVDESGKP
jgi:putative transposase